MARSRRTPKSTQTSGAARRAVVSGILPEGARDAPAWIIAALLIALVLLFINSAFRIDDPLFIWVARHIQAHPANPYGFTVNWYGTDMAMSDVTKNPPLASYYIALAATFFGWREAALHLAFLLPALAVAGGTYVLAKRCCASPALATLAAVVTPVFFVSSLTVMCDVLMLAFWVWAVYLWRLGLGEKPEDRNHVALGVAAVLITAAAMTKYFGMALIPLLAVYSLLKTRRIGWWLVYFAIPVAVLAWYQHATHALYGRGLLLDAAAYASTVSATSAVNTFSMAKLWVTLSFTGGCVATLLCFAHRLWSRPVLYAGLGVAALSTLVLAQLPALGLFQLPTGGLGHWILALQLGLWGTAGLSLLVLAGLDVRDRRDADAWLLLMWTLGAFFFSGFVNWAINGRSILPLAVPAGILIARRLERRTERSAAPKVARWPTFAIIPLAIATVLSLSVTWADSALAGSARSGAEQVMRKFPAAQRTVWFQGHWGFQYYMEQLGAKALDAQRSQMAAGDLVVLPTTSSNLQPMGAFAWAKEVGVIDVPLPWISTMNKGVGAGFYADAFGPLPFACGRVAPERFQVYEIHPELLRR